MLQQGVSGFVAKRDSRLRRKRLENVWQVWFDSLVGKLVLWKEGLPENNFKYISYILFIYIYTYIFVFLLIHVYQHNTCLSSDHTPIGLFCLRVAYVSCQVMTMSHDGFSPQR